MIERAVLEGVFARHGFSLTDEAAGKFDRYAQLLVEWNEKINLTAITAPADIALKHFADSLLLLKALDIPQGTSMIDVGTGAGFPSIPLLIQRPDLRATLLDSLNKRILFLDTLCGELSALGAPLAAETVHARAEEAGRESRYREGYDLATARAVANLRDLSEYCLPFVKTGGYFAALKGYDIEEELEEAAFAIRTLGGEVAGVKKFDLDDENRRAIVLIQKVRPTPAKYPRPSGKIKKSPLISR